MKKMTKKDINALEKLAAPKTGEIEIGSDNTVCRIQYTDYLPFIQIQGIIESITDAVIGYGSYTPLNFDMAASAHFIKNFTNIPVPEFENGLVDIDKCYDIYKRTNLRERLAKASPALDKLLCEIEYCADLQIQNVLNRRDTAVTNGDAANGTSANDQ